MGIWSLIVPNLFLPGSSAWGAAGEDRPVVREEEEEEQGSWPRQAHFQGKGASIYVIVYPVASSDPQQYKTSPSAQGRDVLGGLYSVKLYILKSSTISYILKYCLLSMPIESVNIKVIWINNLSIPCTMALFYP